MLTSTEKGFRFFNSKKETPVWHRGSVSYLVVIIEHSLVVANISHIYMVFSIAPNPPSFLSFAINFIFHVETSASIHYETNDFAEFVPEP